MKLNNFKEQLEHPVFNVISDVASESAVQAFVVGGFVRDVFLNRPSVDIDVVVLGNGVDLARDVADKIGKVQVKVFKTFGTAMIRYKDFEIEFVGARKESYSGDSRKPAVIPGTLDDDQKRRDFTINAMAFSLNKNNFGDLIDPFGGMKDLQNKIIRTPLSPEQTYSDDPLRMMRAIRFATQLNFNIEKKSLDAISNMAYRLNIVSMERISIELNKIILAKKPSIGFDLLFKTGLLKQFFPEMVELYGVEDKAGRKHKDNFYHTLQVLDNIAESTDDLWLRWSAILHDIAKPATKRFNPDIGWTFHGHEDKGARMVPKIFRNLKLPLDNKMKYVQKLVALHLRPIALTKEEATDSAIRRLLFDAGDDIDDLMKLCKADITSKNEEKVKRYLKNYIRVQERLIEVEKNDHIRNWQPPISGELIMDTFNIKPGKEVGTIKNNIKEAILDGIIHNNYEEAHQFMLEEGEKLGLKPQIEK